MFRKISSAAADAHSFSSLASPFTRPPKPTPLNSRNSTSRFAIPAETIGVSTARLQKFLQTNCKSGDVSADEAFCFFHLMVQMEPRFRLYSFNLLLIGLAKNKRYSDVVSLYGKMNSAGLTPNFVTLNILLNCSCNANRVRDAFLVMGRLLRKGYRPNIVTFNSLIQGLCIGSRFYDALHLCMRLEKFGCGPDLITWRTLNRGLRRSRNTRKALKLHEEMVSGNCQYGVRCKPNVSGNSWINDSLCKEGKEEKVMELFSNIDVPMGAINNSRPSPWLRLFCNTVALYAVSDVLGQEELKPNIHSKEKASTCLAWETPHDQLNLKAIEHLLNSLTFEE